MGPFIFFGTFIALSAIIISTFSTMFYYSAKGDFDYDKSSSFLFNDEEYTWIDSATPGYNVTMANTTDVIDGWNTDPSFTVHDDDNDCDLMLAMARNQWRVSDWGEDFVAIYHTWGWWSEELDRISYQELVDKQEPLTNYSIVDFEMHRSQRYYSLIVITPDTAENHSDYIWANEFFIGIAYAPFDPDNIASVTMWGLIGMLFTASIPGVHPLVNYFIAIPLWIGIAFMTFTIVSRMIPFISGG